MRREWHSLPADGVPDRVILFDGVCVLCSRWVAFVIAHDPAARYHFVAIQTPLGRTLAARFGIDAEKPETNIIVIGGRAYFKLESALAVLADFPGWHWTRVAYALPRRVRDYLYDRIAQNRYLSGARWRALQRAPLALVGAGSGACPPLVAGRRRGLRVLEACRRAHVADCRSAQRPDSAADAAGSEDRRRRAGISPRPVASHGRVQGQGADLQWWEIRSDALTATCGTCSTL